MSQELRDLQELMSRTEDLHPDLVPYLDDSGPFGMCLKHPVVFNVVHHPQQNAYVNAQYQQKRESLARARGRQDWATVVWLHERPYRINAFMDVSWHLEGPDYWELFGRVWTDSENQWQDRESWEDMLNADPEGRLMMSSEDARSAFTLPPELGGFAPMTQVYRGYCHDDGLDGFSWTLDKPRARWFAKRLRDEDNDPPAKIAAGLVAREHVIAHITSRDEQEIVVLPEHVTALRIEEVN